MTERLEADERSIVVQGRHHECVSRAIKRDQAIVGLLAEEADLVGKCQFLRERFQPPALLTLSHEPKPRLLANAGFDQRDGAEQLFDTFALNQLAHIEKNDVLADVGSRCCGKFGWLRRFGRGLDFRNQIRSNEDAIFRHAELAGEIALAGCVVREEQVHPLGNEFAYCSHPALLAPRDAADGVAFEQQQ